MKRVGDDLAMDAAKRYVAVAVSGGKGALADLFSADAEFHNPRGHIVQGRDDIRAFYDGHLRNVTVVFRIGRSVAAGNSCWVELENVDPDGRASLVAANHFTVDDQGLITRLAVFLRPTAT
jgi:limonene-1,2-epoxide hydrolase